MKNNETKRLILGCIITMIFYWLSIVVFYIGQGEQLFAREAQTPLLNLEGDTVMEEITDGNNVQYIFTPEIDKVDSITLKFATWLHQEATIHILIEKMQTNEIILETAFQCFEIPDSQGLVLTIPDNTLSGVRDEQLRITITSENASVGNSAGIWINKSEKPNNSQLYYNGQEIEGSLSLECVGYNNVWVGSIYWELAGVTFLVLCLAMLNVFIKKRIGKQALVLRVAYAIKKYWFLIKQLVSRDFKTKYKKSVLGVMWSFINPLLAMSIQYIVFSQIFTNDIENYPLYLLSGYTIFNFFSEAVNLAIESVVGNVALITKVYVPKYIYPFTRVCSSAINLFISMLLLLIMCIIMGVHFTKSILLLPFPIVFIFLFTLGMGSLLATMMVFFRDVKFLWGALSLVWMYATPIFYPASIIPDKYKVVLDLNPITCILELFRTVLIEGQGAEPKLFALCFVYSVGAFVIGTWAFKKNQDKFILYL